jgi:putative redox protein
MASTITITHDGDARFAAQVRGHRVVMDQSERNGGGDAGPTPLDLLAMGLGGCIALYVHRFCESRGLPTEGLRIEVDRRPATAPPRIGGLVVGVTLPFEPAPHVRELLERVMRSCPAHNTLAMGTTVAVDIHSTVAAG